MLWCAGGVLIPDESIKKEFDLVLSNQGGDWNDFARNWTVAKATIKRLTAELDLKVHGLHDTIAVPRWVHT